jgi:type II secretory pathway pseudopilin PulG
MKKTNQLHSNHRGFALIATILLMVLLAIITVGTLSLSVVTVRSGGHESAQGIARANARMALMIAIGELQKQVGPDQRITANSSITNTGSVPNPNWLGVWDSWVAGDLASTKVNSLYSSAGGSAHQTIGSQPDPLMRPTYAQKNRHFRGWLLSLYPEDVSNILAPLISDDTVLLVSSGSAGSSSAATNVSARLINLKPEADQNLLRGRYAWWVGDESQKATIMDDSYRTESSLTMAQRLFRQEAPDSMGNTSVTGLNDMTDETQLAKVASLKSIELLDGVGPEKARPRFHDLTTTSYGVLADVREGGLKRDLNTILERNIDPNEVYDLTTVAEFQRATSMKPGAQDFMLYNFDSLLTSISPIGMANVPIQDLAAYYQLYDHNRPGWKGGVQYSTSQSSPPNTRLSRGAMVSTPDLGYLGNDYDKYLRQYTYQYRSVAPVKQEILLHFVTEQRDFATEITTWLNANRLPPVPPATIGAPNRG